MSIKQDLEILLVSTLFRVRPLLGQVRPSMLMQEIDSLSESKKLWLQPISESICSSWRTFIATTHALKVF